MCVHVCLCVCIFLCHPSLLLAARKESNHLSPWIKAWFHSGAFLKTFNYGFMCGAFMMRPWNLQISNSYFPSLAGNLKQAEQKSERVPNSIYTEYIFLTESGRPTQLFLIPSLHLSPKLLFVNERTMTSSQRQNPSNWMCQAWVPSWQQITPILEWHIRQRWHEW